MQRNAKLILASVSVLALTACGDRQILDTFNSEAGGSGRELPCLPGPMDEKKVPKTQ